MRTEQRESLRQIAESYSVNEKQAEKVAWKYLRDTINGLNN